MSRDSVFRSAVQQLLAFAIVMLMASVAAVAGLDQPDLKTQSPYALPSKSADSQDPVPVRTTPVQTLVIGDSDDAKSIPRPVPQSGPPSPDPQWSCQQANWRDCLEIIVDPPNPGPMQRMNISIMALKADDFIHKSIFHYRYKTPYQNWVPIVSYYDMPGANSTTIGNKEAFIELFGYLGGTLIEFFWDVYDPKNAGLHTDVPPSCPPHQPVEGCIEVSGNSTWPVQCPVPTGFDSCVDISFGYFGGAVKVPLVDMDEVPQLSGVYVNITTKFQSKLASATINYGLYHAGATNCEDDKASMTVKYGPNFERMVVDRPAQVAASIDTIQTSEPGLWLCFNVTATDIYQRSLISRSFTLRTSSEDPTPPVWTGRLTVVVNWINESHGKNDIMPLPGVRVEFSNSSGIKHEGFTDAIGLAYSEFLAYRGSETWTMTAFYQGATDVEREEIPKRGISPLCECDREVTGNYTFYLQFRQTDIPAPPQEEVDQNYFVFMAAGMLIFLAIFAPLSGRHFMEKRRREELKRQEKESRFKL